MNNNLIPAATILVLKDSDNGMKVLMVKRSKRPPFENLYVFPGGKIDAHDHSEEYLLHCDDFSDKLASEKLGLDKGGLGYWVACIRECFEEVGILMARKKSGECINLQGENKIKFNSYRNKLIKNEISLSDICLKEELILTTSNIAPLSHWITPNIETKRFDTRFFIAYLPENQTVEHDGKELTQSLWINPDQAVEKAFSGELQMIMPTIKNLQTCMEFSNAKEMLMHQKKLTNDDIPAILPKFFKENGNWVGLLPGDEGYDDH